jgi:ribosome-associated protein
MTLSPSLALAALCSRTLDGLKAENILTLDLRGVDSSPSDFFVICSATSDVHARALNDALTRATVNVGERRPRSEGRDVGDWVLLDYFDVVVHIFRTESREYYKLEKLWGDAPTVDFAKLEQELEQEELETKKARAKKTSPKAAATKEKGTRAKKVEKKVEPTKVAETKTVVKKANTTKQSSKAVSEKDAPITGATKKTRAKDVDAKSVAATKATAKKAITKKADTATGVAKKTTMKKPTTKKSSGEEAL